MARIGILYHRIQPKERKDDIVLLENLGSNLFKQGQNNRQYKNLIKYHENYQVEKSCNKIIKTTKDKIIISNDIFMPSNNV